MLDEKFEQIKLNPTPSNMFDRAVETGQTCCVQQYLTNMFDPFEHV